MSTPNANLPDDNRPAEGRLTRGGAPPVPALRDPYARSNPYAAPEALSQEDGWATVREYLRVVYKRKWLILSVTAAILTLGALRTLMTTPLYTSGVRLQIDRAAAKVVRNGDDVTPIDSADSDFLRTQYELLQSRTMAERVVSMLKLGDDPDLVKPTEFSITGAVLGLLRSAPPPGAGTVTKAAEEKSAVAVVLLNRVVKPVPGSRLVDVSYSDPNPVRAQRIADAYGAAYIASNLDKRFEANAYAKTFLEDQIKQLKLRLEDSEKVLLDFAQKQQIVEVNDKASIAESNLAAANAALGTQIAERQKNEQLWKQVAVADAVSLPQVLVSKVIEDLRAARNTLSTDYEEKLQIYKPDYPDMLQISKKIKEIDRQIAAEVKTIKDSLKAAYETSLNGENATKARIETLRADVLDLQKRSIQYNILKREVDTNRDLYNSLLQRYKEVDIAGGVGANNVFVVEKAEVSAFPSSPQMGRSLLLALALGLVLALGVAFTAERLDDTVKTPEEGERISGLVTLGIIPKAPTGKLPETELSDPRSGLSEAYRSLCTALQFSTETGLPKTLLVTSSSPGEGKSVTALAVARHFSNLGLKVLLVDADLRKPSLHTKLGLDNSLGLSNYLTGSNTPPEVLQRTSIANLAFMPSGPLPPNAADLLGSARLQSLLTIGLEVFDLIILDGPPVLGIADSLILSSATQAAIFVVGAGNARTGVIRSALKRLHFGRAPLIGSVLTKYDHRSEGYGGRYGGSYGYGYGNGFSYGASDPAEGERLPEAASEPPPQLTRSGDNRKWATWRP